MIPHLLYADDTILLLEEDENCFINVLSSLHIFQMILGLKVNLQKSGVVVVNPESERMPIFAWLAG